MDIDETKLQLEPKVFISFNCKSVDFVDSLEKEVSKKATLIRYEDGVRSWESFTDFMKTIRDEDFAVLVISDAYLKSNACMYEVCQLMQDEDWKNKTMFVIMPDAEIYGNAKRLDYITYWANEYEKYKNRLNGLPEEAIQQELEALEQTKLVRDKIGEFLQIVADVKNPPLYTVIAEICKRIDLNVYTRLKIEFPSKQIVPLSYWYIMEILKQDEDVTANEIVKVTGLSPTHVYRILNQLKNKGLVIAKAEMINNRWTNMYSAIGEEPVGA